jgi:hypothetical protein
VTPDTAADTGADADTDADTDTDTDTGSPPLGDADVRINELLASDGAGGPDWIELYNAGESTADLTGWTLTDDPATPWTFPEATQLRAGAFLLMYADDEAGTETDGLHVPFKLSRSGETVTLADPEGSTGSAVTYPELGDDETYARTTDGGEDWAVVPGGGSPAASNARAQDRD